MLFAPNGLGLARKTILPMSAWQVAWLWDPDQLLRHVGDLHTLKLALYCTHCFEHGFPDTVTAVFHVERRRWELRCACACADYPDVIDRGDGGLEIRVPLEDGTEKIHRLTNTDEFLRLVGWSFKCVGDCLRLGMADGVEGNNDPKTQTLRVSCGCTVRAFHESEHAIA